MLNPLKKTPTRLEFSLSGLPIPNRRIVGMHWLDCLDLAAAEFERNLIELHRKFDECGCRVVFQTYYAPNKMELPDEESANRDLITNTFKRHGFVDYPFEFWHFSQGDAYEAYLTNSATPARYGAVDVDVASGSIEPIDDPETEKRMIELMRKLMKETDAPPEQFERVGL